MSSSNTPEKRSEKLCSTPASTRITWGGNSVFIKVREDRIEIFNEGTLPDSWTYDDFVNEDHTSHPPNWKIASVFHDIGLIECWGNGVRLMIEECKTEGSKPPEFVVNRQGIAVRFYNMLSSEEPARTSASGKLSENESRIYSTILAGNNTKDSIIASTGMSERSVYRYISALKEKGLVIRVGTNRAGHWETTKKP